MSNTLQVTLTDDQLESLAEKIVSKICIKNESHRGPLTVGDMAKSLNVVPETIRRRIKAGIIRTIPGIGTIRIPQSELQRLLAEPE